METDNDLYTQAIKQALKVSFLTSSREINLYAGAIYSAMMWGKEIDDKNQAIQEGDKSLK